ncbi:HTH_Tnp_Tc3_2 domain-containing protein [Trichonephila clavata]|uniref:HTH_Tnp_Tc3_2 domain-containing protein n=1 Tax=Trichonephila clavata TaxID=2740835 RepID=A0A8X6HUX6_TRICU|nr:HTH_Tnp_Tc3_2 domain-containing protein [Trichonephila clavata]
MENRKETTNEERKLVMKLSNEGKSLRNIAKVVGRNVNCIQTILQKFKKTGMLANTEGRGRKKIKNSITERRVIHQVKIDPKIYAPKIAASTSNTLGRSVSAKTVRKVLRKAGYNGRVARKKPLIVIPMRKRGSLGRKTAKSKAVELTRAAEVPDDKNEQDSRQIRSTIVLREQLKLQNNIKCDSSHNKFARMHPEQLKHLSKGNHVSMKIRSTTELPEQLKHLFSMWHVFLT